MKYTSDLPAAGIHAALEDPWEAARVWGEGTVMAVLTATHGPAYRNIGATMAIAPWGSHAGSITSGCVEADLILRAGQLRRDGGSLRLRYGEGSPFFDLRLPCGGAIEVLLLSLSASAPLDELAGARAARQPVALEIGPQDGMRIVPFRPTQPLSDRFILGFPRPLRFVVFGAGPEALIFARLVAGLGHDHLLVSHEAALLSPARRQGCRCQLMTHLSGMDGIDIDEATAVVLFYHDHDYEPEILRRVLGSPAFYIGAQGSGATQAARLRRLRDAGVAEAGLSRLRGPIGLLPSSRDPRTLAVSVLAEIIALGSDLANTAPLTGFTDAAEMTVWQSS
ncbi:XdhC family protein [Pseudogemmobacter humi]|uniref:XdhC and CoxI family protein n=1 Tax=Pseudogemmobacter humi TaxID=2483812 RepID=A0A3P5WY37_9RHOB|nr:XdhC family protein [Pseudogemmobacter humi]VDC19852.1 XdhC and CoxI family protein [Pseudogemmobacter humi]